LKLQRKATKLSAFSFENITEDSKKSPQVSEDSAFMTTSSKIERDKNEIPTTFEDTFPTKKIFFVHISHQTEKKDERKTLSFAELYRVSSTPNKSKIIRVLEMESKQSCHECKGVGLTQTEVKLCSGCSGKKCIRCGESGYETLPYSPCNRCAGSGYENSAQSGLPSIRNKA
jgi:hypothetical protein